MITEEWIPVLEEDEIKEGEISKFNWDKFKVYFELYKYKLLIEASVKGFFEDVKFLFKYGTYVHRRNVYENNGVAFVLAASNGHLDIVKLFIENGINIKITGMAPLMLAASGGHLEVVKFFIESGVCVDVVNISIGQTPLMYAVQSGHFDVVKFLVEFGADVIAKDGEGKTVLSYVDKGDHKIKNYLKEKMNA